MGANFEPLGNIGDTFKWTGTEQPCRVRGCKNMVSISNEQAAYGKTRSKADGGKMCDSCWEFFKTLSDREVPCSKPGCKNTWTWNRYQQLEAHVKGHDTPPKGLCQECRSQVNEKKDIQMPCRTRGCKNTWTWTRKMQVESKDGKAPHRLCGECHKIWVTLEDKQLPCRVKGCKNTTPWTRTQQLEWIREGKKIDAPPRRMCKECLEKFNLLKAVEVPCRVTGCKNTWTWTPFDQLEAVVGMPIPREESPKKEEKPAPAPVESAAPVEAAAPVESAAPVEAAAPVEVKEEPKYVPVFNVLPPKRMCKECYAFFEAARDREEPCCNRGCEEKWVWTRAMQLAAHVHGHDQPGRRMCDKCQKALKELKPIQEPCQEADCHGTWTYTPEEQLRDSLLKRPPQMRHCPGCEKFLKENPPQELTCEKCGSKFAWSSHEQLLTKLGTFKKPMLCANCNSAELAAMPPAPPVIIPAALAPFKVKMPSGGPWGESPVTRDWPAGLSNERIAAVEEARRRIVFIGDDLVADAPEVPSLPSLLEASLNGTQDEGGSCAVLNVGMPGCTTSLGTRRIGRDIAPFAPETVIFSFAFADAAIGRNVTEGTSEMLARLANETQEFIDAVRGLENPPRLVCWLPNPVYPQLGGVSDWRSNDAPDVVSVNRYGAVLRNLKSVCEKNGIAVADGKAIFDMQGQKTAVENMATWCRANAEGCKTHLRAILSALES